MQKGILLLFVGLLLTFSVKAQDVERISLEDAIEIALENNYQLKVASNNVDFAELQEWSEKADFLPSVNARLDGNRRTGRSFDQNTGVIVTETNHSISGGISASLPIFRGFENINTLRSSQYNTQSRKENLQRVRENIIFNTASSYLQYILNKQFLEIDRENLEASKKTLEQVKAQVEVGSRPTVDLYNQEAIVANNEFAVVNSENALQSSRLQLIQSMQIDPLKEYEFITPDIEKASLNVSDYNLDNLVASALESRSDLRSEELNIQAIKHQLSATRASLYPSLSLSASLGSNYSELIPFDFQDQFFDQNIQRSLSLSLIIPIFNNWNRRTNIQSQQVNYKNAQLNLRDTELQIVQEVNQAYNDYRSYLKQLESSEKALRAAERSYQTQKQRYEVGAGTLIELSEANAQYVEAQANEVQALFRVIFQQKLLDYFIGKLDQNITFN